MRSILRNIGLTGNFQFKANFWGSQVLWVEESCVYHDTVDMTASPEFTRWRKANMSDVGKLDLR